MIAFAAAPKIEAEQADAYLGVRQATPPIRRAKVDRSEDRREVRAKFDAASDSVEYQNYWANADSYDADSAHSKSVRQRLVKRSRYEVGNNGFADGIIQTHANFLVGIGPKLRVIGVSNAKEIEKAWTRWAKRIQLRRKLWCMSHAKTQDGEAFAMLIHNPRLADRVQLDIVLIETEQVQTPYLPYRAEGVIDGVTFDRFGNVLTYDILPQHPGGQWAVYYQTPQTVPARFVLHWFQLRRPGQHRGIPEFRSTLQVGASSRRWREATVSAAETAASFAAAIETDMPAGDADPIRPFDTFEIERRTGAALPMGWKLNQMRAEHPNATYEAFSKGQINEQARPKSMPYNLAACDSSSYNYASGKLDHQTYFVGLDVEREDGNDLVLDPLFSAWYSEAAPVYGWDREEPEVAWDWPQHPVADVVSEASAQDTKLKNGTLSLSLAYSNAGEEYAEQLATMATDYGVPVERVQEMLRLAIFNATNQIGSIEQAKVQRDVGLARQANQQTQEATQ